MDLACRFKQDTKAILELAGSTWLKNQESARSSGSPRSRWTQPQEPFAQASSEDAEGSAFEGTEAPELDEQQAAALVDSVQQLEQVVVAGESLCR